MSTLIVKDRSTALPALCPDDLTQIFTDKWSLPVLYCLINSREPVRYKALLTQIATINEKDLSRQLRFLRARELIAISVCPIDSTSKLYEATELACALQPTFESLAHWIQTYQAHSEHTG